MKNLKFLLIPLIFLRIFILSSQETLPNEVIIKVNDTEKRDLFTVADVVKFDKQILRTNQLVFSSNSTLELSNTTFPWIAIIADSIKFAAPLKKATIRRNLNIIAKKGGTGKKAANGNNGGRSGRHGHRGGNGFNGEQGDSGETLNLPDIYIITNGITSQQSNQAPDYINLKLIFPGIDGGRGGNGGNGGNGGKGGNGRKGSDGPGHCRSGGGNGGQGGNAGLGGQGGNGGTGGNGANIYLVGNNNTLDILSYATIINTGGEGGLYGRPGLAGTPGLGGGMGRGSTFCGGGRSGVNGIIPNPDNLGIGSIGNDGQKGSVIQYKIDDFDLLTILPKTNNIDFVNN